MKFFFALCFAIAVTVARGQIYIDSYRFGAAASTALLLDSVGGYPGAVAAYSLRKLRTNYTGNCIMVIKDNNDSINIGFSGNYIDTIQLKNQCGTGAGDSCRVRIWYDQSGNANNLRQNVDTMLPLIVVNGAILYSNGEVGLRFLSNKLSNLSNYSSGISFNTSFSVTRFATRPAVSYLTTNANNSTRILYDYSGYKLYNTTDFNSGINPSTTNQDYIYAFYNSANSEIKINNNSLVIGNPGSTGSTGLIIGAPTNFSPFACFNGFYYELILYNSNQSANESGIRNNINLFYLIY